MWEVFKLLLWRFFFFQNCVADCGVEDIKGNGRTLTWSNGTIHSRIDKALVNEDWMRVSPSIEAHFGVERLSDHSSIVINIAVEWRKSKRQFKYLNMWAMNEKFAAVVKTVWDQRVRGTTQFLLWGKLMYLQKGLEELHTSCFPDVLKREETTRIRFAGLQQELSHRPSDMTRLEEVHQTRNQLIYWSKAAVMYMAQKAKEEWIIKGDKNTAYFHVVMRRKAYRNTIYSIHNARGEVVNDQPQIADCFKQYYMKLLGTKETRTGEVSKQVVDLGPKLSIGQQLLLIKPFSDQDIKRALWYISELKSPGPYGYRSGFFKKSWDIVASDLCAAVKEFF